MPVISDGEFMQDRAGTRYIIPEAQCSRMIELVELVPLFIAGAVIVVALCLYNKFGKVKDQ